MTSTIRGTDNTAASPALTGTDTTTGIFFPSTGVVAFATAGTEDARIDASGNLRVNNSASMPAAHPSGNINCSNDISTGSFLVGVNGSFLGRQASDGSTVLNTGQANVVFSRGAYGSTSESGRFDNSGNFLVNTTTSNSNTFKFKVQTTTDVCMGFASATAVAGAVTFNAINDSNSANVPLDFRASSIHASNGIATTANAANANFSAGENNKFYRSTSALKYKQDIRDIELIDINRFRPVRYKSKCEDDDQTKDHFGIIADEVHAAGLTELVTYGVEQEVEGFQYERLTVVLLKHCQEQQAIIQSLTDRIAALEAKG